MTTILSIDMHQRYFLLSDLQLYPVILVNLNNANMYIYRDR